MSAPLKVEGRTIGVLNVSSNRQGTAFTEEDLAKLAAIAEQISGILDRAIRVARRDRDAIELRARREIEIAFSRKGLELIERLRMVAGRLAELMGAEAVQIHLADESLDRFRTVSSAGRHGQEGELPLHHGLLARALSEPRPLLLTIRSGRPLDAAGDEALPKLLLAPLLGSRPLWVRPLEHESTLARRAVESRRELVSMGVPPDELRRMIEEHGVAAYAFIPIRVDEDVAGVLGVIRPTPRRGAEPAPGLSRLDVQTLRKLALYVSLALENARRAGVRSERITEDSLTGLLGVGGFDARVGGLAARQSSFPDEIATGGELLSLVRTAA